jgi:hypothetical protein
MYKNSLTRVLAVTGGVTVCGASLADAWWFFGFTRFYFPKAEIGGLLVHFMLWVPALAYFASVAFTARWAPWKRWA